MSKSHNRPRAGTIGPPSARLCSVIAITALAMVSSGAAWAQASVSFVSIGVQSGVPITVNVSYTDPTNNPVSGTYAFNAPGPGTPIAAAPGTSFSFSFPTTLTDGSFTYSLDRAFTASPLTTGASGTTTTVQVRYGLDVDFATSGLPGGTPISVLTSYTNGRGIPISNQTVSFSSSGTSAPIITQLGTAVTYSYPVNVTVGTTTYVLQSSTPSSGFTSGAAGTSTHVVATYAPSGPTTPTVTAPSDQSASEGSQANLDLGSFADPDGGPWSVDVQWGDSSTDTTFNTASTGSLGTAPHAYPDNGTYTVTVKATDSTGLSDSKSFSVSVTNAAPTATIQGAPASSPEGTPISLTSQVTDPSSADTAAGFTFNWSVTKDGTPFASGSADGLTFTPDDNGTYVVTLTATDKDGGAGSDSRTITVTNVAPSTAVLGVNSPVLVNQSLTVNTTFSDPGSDAPWSVAFNWGDGSPVVPFAAGPADGPALGVPLSLGHSFSSSGTYTIEVDATDKDGAAGSSKKDVKVIYGVSALFTQSGSGKAYKKGSTIPIKIQIRDANGNVSSAALPVHATGEVQTDADASAEVLDSGNANPDSDFRYDSGLQGYIFNLSTKDLSTGTWKLSFTVNGQPDDSYSVTFDIR